MPAYSLRINGRSRDVTCDAKRSLLSVLREEFGLTGAKHGCGEGQCGTCTVLLDGEPVRCCVLPVSAVGGRTVITIEGLAQGQKLHPVQQAFLELSAFQCGFCTPGMILGAAGFLNKRPDPTVEEIKAALERNICRCGTYPRIVQAVRMAAEAKRRG